MMKKGFTLLILVMLLLTFTMQVYAQNNGFEDTFDNATLDGWEHSQDVIVSEGILRINPGNFAFRNGEFAGIAIQITLRPSTPGSIMIHYHATDQGAYGLHIMEEEIILDKVLNEQPSLLQAVSFSGLPQNEWSTLTISFQDNQHQVSIGNEQIISVSDTEPLQAGSIGLVATGENAVEIDQIKVSASNATSLAPAGEEPMGEEPVGEEPMEERPEGEGAVPAEGAAPAQQTTPTAIADRASLLDELFTSRADPLALQTFVVNLLLAAVLAFVLGRVYIHWGASLSNRRKFATNFMLMTVTTTFIILVVRSSVALSLGLVGALSIVRFRTAVKEPEELAYLFLSIGIGIGLGDNQRLITLLAFTIAILILGILKLTHRAQADANLNLTIASHNPQKIDLEDAMQALAPHCAKIKLLRFDETRSAAEMSFLLEFKHLENLNAAKNALRLLSDEIEITFLDNKGIW